MVKLEDKLKDYIKERSQEKGVLSLPLTQIADDIDSSAATVWRAIQKLEDKKIIRVVKSDQKIQPSDIYYLGEKDEVGRMIDDLMVRSATMTVMLKELKQKVDQKDKDIFDLKMENDHLKTNYQKLKAL